MEQPQYGEFKFSKFIHKEEISYAESKRSSKK
jgi:hypothetical protein